MRRGLAALSLLSASCASVPTPLAPGVGGSVGYASLGVLTASSPLPDKGPGYRRLRPWTDAKHGTPSMIKALTEAAARVSGPDDPPMLVGDISGPRGGPLRGHHSHRTGRDVDILFFFTTPGGVPIEAPGFVKVGPDGLAQVEGAKREFVRFDVARNWRLVRALVTSTQAEVQWLFCATPVEAILIEYARALGEPAEIVWHAESVLHQPGDSAPHDDHFHMRIGCSDDEAVAGCVTGTPTWPWARPAPTLGDRALAELLPQLSP